MTRSNAPPPDGRALDAPLAPLTETALGWLTFLHSGQETEADWAAYEAWRSAGPEHQAAADQAERLWAGLGSALRRPRGGGTRRALLASAGLAVLGGLGFASGMFGPPAAFFPDLSTTVGERRIVTLADGSRLEMDAATSLDVAFTASERCLELYAGRIFVTVASEPARPFIVRAEGGAVRALGTAFEVGRDGEEVTVAVAEHMVRVSYPEGGSGPYVDVGAGRGVEYTRLAGLGAPHAVDVTSRIAWRDGLLAFQGRPLSEVVSQIERYRHGRILIADSALGRLPVTGLFESSDTDALLDALTAALPVVINRLPWLTVIRRDPSRPLEPFTPRK